MAGTRAKILPLLGNQFQPQVSGQLLGLYEKTKNKYLNKQINSNLKNKYI